MAQHLFHISGMHCRSCIHLVESELKQIDGITSAKASLRKHQVSVESHLSPDADMLALLAPALQKHGFTLSPEKPAYIVSWRDFIWAIPLALLFLAGFVALQRLGLVDLLAIDQITYPAAFLIGLVASISSCMAVTGGLTLSISANYAKEGRSFAPQALFHTGRLIAFALLGGLLGLLGEQLMLGTGTILWLNLGAALVMLLLGVNLLDILPWAKRLQPALPGFLANHVLKTGTLSHTLAPALLGALTFFLPCGFTQSMQFFALASGSFGTGSLTLLAFALGTLPVLAALSFAALALPRRASGIFFKTAGLIVIAFGLLNLANVLAVMGLIPLLGSFWP